MIRSFFSAMAFLTIVPIPRILKSRRENAMFFMFPVVGLVIGAALSGLLLVAEPAFGRLASVVMVVAAGYILTGAIHVDGLADCADAFYGIRSRKDVLRILKDPRIGTMGGLAIGLALLARFACLSSLPLQMSLISIPLMCAFSRTAVLFCVQILPYARAEKGILRARPARSAPLLAVACAATAATAALLPVPTLAASMALAGFWALAHRKTGGYTGDVLGASIELAEIVFLLSVVCTTTLGLKPGLLWVFALDGR
jgi:adenosylcobinamide-GDP ribazoletransferase